VKQTIDNFIRQTSPFRGIEGVLKTTSPDRDRVLLLKKEEKLGLAFDFLHFGKLNAPHTALIKHSH